jgi:hypothetical protein
MRVSSDLHEESEFQKRALWVQLDSVLHVYFEGACSGFWKFFYVASRCNHWNMTPVKNAKLGQIARLALPSSP